VELVFECHLAWDEVSEMVVFVIEVADPSIYQDAVTQCRRG